MPFDFVAAKRTYTFNGRPFTRSEVREEIEKLITHVQREAASIADRFHAGSISATEFEIEMRELLKAGHIIAASVGRGGRARMTQADWGQIGAKIKWQYDYLAKFVRKLGGGKLEKAYSANRARSYASSIYISYSNARQQTQTEPIDGGSDQRGGQQQQEVLVRLITNSKEGCVECAADEAEGWMPADDMAPLGTRLCGDFCLCELEFSDEG